MSKSSLIIVGLCVAILAVAGYVFFHKGTVTQAMSGETSVLLYVEEGDVSYKNPDMGNFQKATTSPIVIMDGTKVATGLGKATILFPNNSSSRLDHYTELTVSYQGNNVSFFQTAGTTYHRVEAVVTGGSYEVRTPGTLAAVRGTRFAVKYDKKAKLTKVSVTEHKVSVTKLVSDTATSTEGSSENVVVEENSTASVGGNQHIDVGDTAKDSEMKAWVDENKGRDEVIDKIKSDNSTGENEKRDQMKEVIVEHKETRGTEDVSGDDSNTPKQDTSKKSSQDTQAPKPVVKDDTTTDDSVPAKKVDEEVFFDSFNDIFTSYFYLDEKDTPCSTTLSPEQRVSAVSSLARKSGYPISDVSIKLLTSFATDIQSYCRNKDPSVKVKLQAMFDADYPYQDGN